MVLSTMIHSGYCSVNLIAFHHNLKESHNKARLYAVFMVLMMCVTWSTCIIEATDKTLVPLKSETWIWDPKEPFTIWNFERNVSFVLAHSFLPVFDMCVMHYVKIKEDWELKLRKLNPLSLYMTSLLFKVLS